MTQTLGQAFQHYGYDQPFVFRVGPLIVDFTRTHFEPELWYKVLDSRPLARGTWKQTFEDLVNGEILNSTENRAALHTASRGFRVPETDANGFSVKQIVEEGDLKMRHLVETIRSSKRFDVILHVGIGGSALGPELVIESLSCGYEQMFDVRFITNIDYHKFLKAVGGLTPSRTLIVVASKSWTTAETQTNLSLLKEWFADNSVDINDNIVAVTSAMDKASADGIPESRILPFGEWVGGRFSVWSPVGVTIALQYGWDIFEAFREGGCLMDRHVEQAGNEPSAPVVSAIMGLSYADEHERSTRAVIPYDGRLEKLVPYLQQLEMESNGKQTTIADEWYNGPAMPVVWGGVGTDAQHSVFQWLHQATDWCSVEFLFVANPDHNRHDIHGKLIANCLSQSSALMNGQENLADPSRHYSGGIPSTVIVIDRMTPEAVGALLAFYEYRTFAMAQLMGINAFDQMGVELGKSLAKNLEAKISKEETSDLDPPTTNLLKTIFEMQKPSGSF